MVSSRQNTCCSSHITPKPYLTPKLVLERTVRFTADSARANLIVSRTVYRLLALLNTTNVYCKPKSSDDDLVDCRKFVHGCFGEKRLVSSRMVLEQDFHRDVPAVVSLNVGGQTYATSRATLIRVSSFQAPSNVLGDTKDRLLCCVWALVGEQEGDWTGSSLVLFVLGRHESAEWMLPALQCGFKAFQGSEGPVADELLWCSANLEIFSIAVAVSPQPMAMPMLRISEVTLQKCIECLPSRHTLGQSVQGRCKDQLHPELL